MRRRKESVEEGRGVCGDLHAPKYRKIGEIIRKDESKTKTNLDLYIQA